MNNKIYVDENVAGKVCRSS